MQRDKPYLFIDFDDTLVDSLPVVVDILNKRYGTNFKPSDVNSWDAKDCWPDLEDDELTLAFECDEFWENVKPKYWAMDSLKLLRNKYNIYVISKGTHNNLNAKKIWLDKWCKDNDIPIIDMIRIPVDGSKGAVNMPPKSVMVDDNEQYLDESKATIKILYESYTNKPWNRHWVGRRTNNWAHLFVHLCSIHELMTGGLDNE